MVFRWVVEGREERRRAGDKLGLHTSNTVLITVDTVLHYLTGLHWDCTGVALKPEVSGATPIESRCWIMALYKGNQHLVNS
jgi:hypothetical protein